MKAPELWPEVYAECPHCHLSGYHPFTLRTFEARTIPGADGPIAVPEFGDPPAGTAVMDRTCCHCGHAWMTAA